MNQFLDTTSQNVVWFKKVHDSGSLEMSPPFQRNPVWVERQKSYLIDTILNGFPIPEIYMQEKVTSSGKAKYIVVDGQQRIRAILDYLEGKFSIDLTDSPNWGDMYFDDLSEEDKQVVFSYKFVIRNLPQIDDVMLRDIFQRLNRNVVALNRQELRHAIYWGKFIKLMHKISDDSSWSNLNIFSPNDVRRMLDIEYISELAIAFLNGPQNKKQNIEHFYQVYEQEFEDEIVIETVFKKVLEELVTILAADKRSRWIKKTDFYTLFLLFTEHDSSLPLTREGRVLAKSKLSEFEIQVNKFVKTEEDETVKLSDDVKKYGSGIRASTDLGSRKRRSEALSNVLQEIWEK